MLVIVGTVRLPPDKIDAARPAMRRIIEASRAEPACLAFSYAEDVLDTGLIRVAEVGTDRAALDAHVASDHIAAWRRSWPDLGLGDRHLALHEAGEPRAT